MRCSRKESPWLLVKESSYRPSLAEPPKSLYTALFSPDPLPTSPAPSSPFAGVRSLSRLEMDLESAARSSELHLWGANVHGLRAHDCGHAAVTAAEGAGCAAGGADGGDAGSVVWWMSTSSHAEAGLNGTVKCKGTGGELGKVPGRRR